MPMQQLADCAIREQTAKLPAEVIHRAGALIISAFGST